MFSNKIKALWNQKGFTQKDLANAIHVSRSSIAKWEQGRGYPTEESIQDLCNFFKIDRENLIDDDKEILKNYYAHEKRKRRLWIFASAAAILVIAGGITGGVWYYQANNYSNAPLGKLTNSLQSQCFLAEIGKAFPLSKDNVVPNEGGVVVSRIDFSGYDTLNYYTFKNCNMTFSKKGFYQIYCRVYDDASRLCYSEVRLRKFSFTTHWNLLLSYLWRIWQNSHQS